MLGDPIESAQHETRRRAHRCALRHTAPRTFDILSELRQLRLHVTRTEPTPPTFVRAVSTCRIRALRHSFGRLRHTESAPSDIASKFLRDHVNSGCRTRRVESILLDGFWSAVRALCSTRTAADDFERPGTRVRADGGRVRRLSGRCVASPARSRTADSGGHGTTVVNGRHHHRA